ncbi:hypothetical protein [Bacillus cereus group sp. MYBK227-1]|uniref:hypothetical protein n=1 Tax=Bacillus cereus group sp. MYBK227-1 TaxID=3450654 RepID=UPI003F795614
MQKRSEFKISKKQKIMLACVFGVPFIISLFIGYMIFGNYSEALSKMWAYKGKPNATASSITSLSYIFTILLAFYTFVTTSIFSYFVWKVSKRSLKVSEKLQSLEFQREEEVSRENALIVYYDLQRGISNLQELYINYELKGIGAKPSKIYFSTDWIKNVANLRDQLTEQELNKVYKLYEQLHALQNLLEKHDPNKSDEALKTQLKILSEEVFANFIPLQVLERHNVSSANELVNIDLYVILKKIYYLTFPPSKRPPAYKNESTGLYETTLDGNLFFSGDNPEPFIGTGKLYNTNKEVKCFGEFKAKQFDNGQFYGYYSPGHDFYTVKYSKTLAPDELEHVTVYQLNNDRTENYYYKGQYKHGKIYDGFSTLFDNYKNDIIYQGEIKGGYKEGEGTSYYSNGEIEFKGSWNQDYIDNGIQYSNGKKTFEGKFKLTKDSSTFSGIIAKPWTGIVTNYDISFEIKDFTGEIYNGKPITGHGDFLYLDSQGRDFKEYQHDEMQALERAEYEDTNPVEINAIDIEQQLEDEAKENNDRDRQTYFMGYNEYIKANWSNGNVIMREKNERNIKIYDARG